MTLDNYVRAMMVRFAVEEGQRHGGINNMLAVLHASDFTGGALFYCEPSQPMAEWFRREIIERPDDHKRTAHIGQVWFYA